MSPTHPTLRSQCEKAVLPVYRILVVEDQNAIYRAGAKALVHVGCEVHRVRDGQSGWEALRHHSYATLITDYRMPGLGGIELIRKLRAEKMALPVILAADGLGIEEMNEHQWLQPVISLLKPFTSTEMLTIVARLLPGLAGVSHAASSALGATSETFHDAELWRCWGLNE